MEVNMADTNKKSPMFNKKNPQDKGTKGQGKSGGKVKAPTSNKKGAKDAKK
jgi:hypothetical protein